MKSKTVQIETIKSIVNTEMKTWSDVVSDKLQKSEESVRPGSITKKNIKEAVKSVEVEKEKLKNIMVYNVQEEAEEDEFDIKDDSDDDDDEQDDEYTVKQILLKTAGINAAKVDYNRVGQKNSDKKRPIIVRLENTRQVAVILSNARKLKDDPELKYAFLDPDRTKEQKEIHRKLVIKLKKQREEDPSNRFFIRNGIICSADKN